MADFADIINIIVNFMKIEFNLWGYKTSLWAIFIWGILASIVLWTVMKVFGGDK